MSFSTPNNKHIYYGKLGDDDVLVFPPDEGKISDNMYEFGLEKTKHLITDLKQLSLKNLFIIGSLAPDKSFSDIKPTGKRLIRDWNQQKVQGKISVFINILKTEKIIQITDKKIPKEILSEELYEYLTANDVKQKSAKSGNSSGGDGATTPRSRSTSRQRIPPQSRRDSTPDPLHGPGNTISSKTVKKSGDTSTSTGKGGKNPDGEKPKKAPSTSKHSKPGQGSSR